VLWVVDRSTSMAESDAWQDVMQAVSQAAQNLQDHMHMGLMLYPAPQQGLAGLCAEGALQVPMRMHNATDIAQALQTPPFGNTPTASTLHKARTLLNTLPTEALKALVLVTDGGPGCNNTLNPATCTCIPGAVCVSANMCLDDVRTYQALSELKEDGIHTYVVGAEGSHNVFNLLEAMAIAAGQPHHYPSYNLAELTSTLNVILQKTQQQTSCL
jgi:Mg-chelatase subunit ChlD